MPEVEGGESSDDIYPFHGVDGENNPIGPCDAFWKRVLTKKIRKDVDDDENGFILISTMKIELIMEKCLTLSSSCRHVRADHCS